MKKECKKCDISKAKRFACVRQDCPCHKSEQNFWRKSLADIALPELIARNKKKNEELDKMYKQSPKPDSWEVEFETTFKHHWVNGNLESHEFQEIIDFIKSLLDKTREEGYKEAERNYKMVLVDQSQEFLKKSKENTAQARQSTLAEVREELKHIAMYHDMDSACYNVKDVLKILTNLEK